jgi:P4 family phage/plasmid primase-like protien
MNNWEEKVSKHLGFPIPHFPLDGKFHHFPADKPRKKPLWAIGQQWVYKGNTFWSLNCGNFQNPDQTFRINSWDENPVAQTKYFMQKAREEQAVLQAKVNQEKIKKHEICKTKSMKTVKSLTQVDTHSYLQKKGIEPFCAKQIIDEYKQKLLVVPAYDENGLVGLQYISEKGSKWFSEGIKIDGAIAPLKRFRESQVVYVAEGYATACSLQMATSWPVVCCFTAGNIAKALKTISKINPDCWVVICGDNDKINEQTGYRPGRHYATLAQLKHKRSTVIFPYADEEKIGDFNDLHAEIGTDALSEKIFVDLEKIKAEYEKRITATGFSYHDERGQIRREYKTLLEFFIYKSNYFYVGDVKKIYVFNGKYYEEVDESFIRNFAQKYFEPYCEKASHINEFVDLVKRTNVKKQSFLKQDNDFWLPFNNGLYNYLTNDFIPHTPKIKKFYVIPHNYDPNAKAPTLELMLKNLTNERQELVDQLEEFMGFALSGMSYERFQKFFVLAGGGQNGKSTFLEMLRELVGPENCSAIKLSDLTKNRFAGIKLEHALLNISEEEPRECFQSTGPLKQLTGNSVIQVEEKNKPSYSTINKAKIILSYNEIPFIHDLSDGMKRRMEIVPFDVNLKNEPEKMIKDVHDKLRMEYSGIVNVAIRGLKRLMNQGFTYSKYSQEKLNEMIVESNPIIEWFEEEVEITSFEGDFISSDNLFMEFQAYSNSNITKRNFIKKILNHYGHRQIKKARRTSMRGLCGLKYKYIKG